MATRFRQGRKDQQMHPASHFRAAEVTPFSEPSFSCQLFQPFGHAQFIKNFKRLTFISTKIIPRSIVLEIPWIVSVLFKMTTEHSSVTLLCCWFYFMGDRKVFLYCLTFLPPTQNTVVQCLSPHREEISIVLVQNTTPLCVVSLQ